MGSSRTPCAVTNAATFVSVPKPAPARVTSFATTSEAFFLPSFFRAFSSRFCVSAAKATINCPSRFFAPTAAATSGVG